MRLSSNEKHELALISVSNAWPKLVAAAAELNIVSGEMNAVVAELETYFKGLNLGIEVLVSLSASKTFARWFGYGKVNKQWGLKIIDESLQNPNNTIEYRFNDAPRWMRVDSLGRLPDLMEDMLANANGLLTHVVNADKIIADVREGLRRAQQQLQAEGNKTANEV